MRDKIYTDKNIIGERIDNIEETGALTGRYFSDLHGTWYEVKPDKRNSQGLYLYFWMVGEPREGDTPDQSGGLTPLPDFKELAEEDVKTRREALRDFLTERPDEFGGYAELSDGETSANLPLIPNADFWCSEGEASAESDQRWLVLTYEEHRELDIFIRDNAKEQWVRDPYHFLRLL